MPDPTGRRWRAVVAGFDETDRGRCAVRWAATRAVRHGCPLYVVGVLEPPPDMVFGWAPVMSYAGESQRSSAEQRLLAEVEACRDAHPGLDVHATLHEGHPSARLADYAEQVGADLVAVGWSNRGRWSRLVLGSTVDDLVRATGRPVVVVRDTTPVQQAGALTGQSPVVAGVVDLAGSGPILDFAFAAAAHHEADLTVLVPAEPVTTTGFDAHVDRWRSRYPQVAVATVAVGAPLPALLERSELARLLVVGHREAGPLRRLRAGSSGRGILHDAGCSVAVVNPGGWEHAAPLRVTGRSWVDR